MRKIVFSQMFAPLTLTTNAAFDIFDNKYADMSRLNILLLARQRFLQFQQRHVSQ
jgi:hypothetical protein